MRRKLWMGMAACLAIWSVQSGTARAVTTYQSPFGDVPVNAYVGSLLEPFHDVQIIYQVIYWIRKSDDACQLQVIGVGDSISDDTVVWGTSGDDGLSIVPPPFCFNNSCVPYNVCNTDIYPPTYGGHYLDLDGRDGNDELGSTDVDTWLWGGAGDDYLFFFDPTGQLHGWDGNDTLISDSAIYTGEVVLGENGDDCMEDSNAAAAVYDCGPGNDSTTQNRTPPNAVNCENTVFTCPNPPF